GSNSSLDAPPVVYGDILNMARAMAAEDPKRVAKVVKDWVAEQ
ncbi:MAG: flagellar biosynthesis/type III secretory pathway M-ring protein FliF/YscJ, partial [Porticoccaceae bacterium]